MRKQFRRPSLTSSKYGISSNGLVDEARGDCPRPTPDAFGPFLGISPSCLQNNLDYDAVGVAGTARQAEERDAFSSEKSHA